MSENTITCPVCGFTSHHPNDVREGYCGRCHAWTSAACELEPERVRAHTSRGDRCPICYHLADEHPHGGAADRPGFSTIYDRVYSK